MKLKVNNKTVTFYNGIEITMQYNAIADSFGFSFYFNPENDLHRELSEIGSYYPVTLTDDNGQRLLTGTILTQKFKSQDTRQLVVVGGYSKTGVLGDSQIPTELYPLETEGLSVVDISKRLCDYFGISVKDITDQARDASAGVVPDEWLRMNLPIEKTTAKETQKIADYLSKLASQRDVVTTCDEYGQLVYDVTRLNQRPLITYRPEQRNGIVAMDLNFNGQSSHSLIEVIKEQSDEKDSEPGQDSITNPLVKSTKRTAVKTQTTGDEFSTEKAARLALADELRNLTVSVSLNSWYSDGKLIKPNNLIEIQNPEIHLYQPTKFFIEEVKFKQNESGRTCELSCVLPEVYGGNRQNI